MFTVQSEMNSPSTEDSYHNNVPLGVITLLAQIVISVGLAGMVKHLSAEVALFTILFCRYLFCMPLLLCAGFYQRGWQLFQINQKRTLIARIMSGLLGLASYFTAIAYLNISTATVLGQTLSLFITLLAPIFLAEKVGFRRLIGVCAGFIGVVVLINPDSQGITDYHPIGLFFGILAPLAGAMMFIFLRKLGASEAPISTALWYNLTGVFLFLILLRVFPHHVPDWQLLPSWAVIILICLGVASSFQQFLMAWSHKLAPASTLAPVHYTSVPLSIGVGVLFFHDRIGAEFIIGTLILLASSWYIARREKFRDAGTQR